MSVAEDTVKALLELHDLEDEINDLKPRKESKTDLKSKMEVIRAKVPPMVLGHHDRVRARNKRSVSEVRNGVCAGCHMTVPVGTVNILRRGEDIQLCANCGRYLYLQAEALPPVESAQEEAAKSAETKPKRPRKKKAPAVASEN
jgi:predicted  nucleic acid-binding Zn-ribbon protein